MTIQLVNFRAYFFVHPHPPTLNLKKNPVNQLIKILTKPPNINTAYYAVMHRQVKKRAISVLIRPVSALCFGAGNQNGCSFNQSLV